MTTTRRALGGEQHRLAPADAPAGAGDDGDLAVERSHAIPLIRRVAKLRPRGFRVPRVPAWQAGGMRVTFLGHAGMYVETEGGTVLCDPWFTPAYFGSWFPFPRNDRLDPAAFARPDYLYISHLHHDHFDPEWLAEHVDKTATVLLPAFELDHLERALRDLGFTEFVHTEHAKPVQLGALEVAILAMTAPADGPAGDSALVLADSTARLLNQNDARPRDLHELEALGPFDAHFTQFSGAIWYPMVYDFPADEKRALGIRKRADQMERAMHYIRGVQAPHVFPVAGPAVLPRRRPVRVQRPRRRPGEHLPGPDRVPRRARSGRDRRRRAARARARSPRSRTVTARWSTRPVTRHRT